MPNHQSASKRKLDPLNTSLDDLIKAGKPKSNNNMRDRPGVKAATIQKKSANNKQGRVQVQQNRQKNSREQQISQRRNQPKAIGYSPAQPMQLGFHPMMNNMGMYMVDPMMAMSPITPNAKSKKMPTKTPQSNKKNGSSKKIQKESATPVLKIQPKKPERSCTITINNDGVDKPIPFAFYEEPTQLMSNTSRRASAVQVVQPEQSKPKTLSERFSKIQ